MRRATKVGLQIQAALLGAVLAVGLGSPDAVRAAATCTPALAASPQWLSEGPANPIDAAINLPSRGTVRAKVLYVDFPDAPATTDPNVVTSSWLSGGSAWLRASSYGRFDIKLDPVPSWFRMPRASTAYGFPGITYEQHRDYIADAYALADAAVDFSQTDLVYIVASPTAAIPQSPTFRGLRGEFIRDGRDVGSVVTFGRDGYSVGRTTVAHEVGHLLGLPDIYPLDGGVQHRYVGSWDVMGNIFQPTDLFAWHRMKLGWLDRPQFSCAPRGRVTQTTLTPLGTSGGKKAIFIPTGPWTALVVENRQRVGNDRRICEPGVLVYSVDARIATGAGPVKVIGGRMPNGCGYGPRSDAPLRPGQRLVVGRTTITVLPSKGTNRVVRVTR